MNEELALDCFRAALAYVSEHCPEELEWVRGITPELFDRMTCPEFLEEYCWVVYAAGFRVSTLTKKFGALKTAFCDFDIDCICQMKSLDPALGVINNQRKAKGFVEGCRRIRGEGFENFKARVKTGGMDALQSLPYIGSVTKKHLARNIGLLDVSKNDVHLVRLVREFGACEVEELTSFLSEETGEKQGVVDLVLWRYCADGAWEEWWMQQNNPSDKFVMTEQETFQINYPDGRRKMFSLEYPDGVFVDKDGNPIVEEPTKASGPQVADQVPLLQETELNKVRKESRGVDENKGPGCNVTGSRSQ
jgi:hypothetical protein